MVFAPWRWRPPDSWFTFFGLQVDAALLPSARASAAALPRSKGVDSSRQVAAPEASMPRGASVLRRAAAEDASLPAALRARSAVLPVTTRFVLWSCRVDEVC